MLSKSVVTTLPPGGLYPMRPLPVTRAARHTIGSSGIRTIQPEGLFTSAPECGWAPGAHHRPAPLRVAGKDNQGAAALKGFWNQGTPGGMGDSDGDRPRQQLSELRATVVRLLGQVVALLPLLQNNQDFEAIQKLLLELQRTVSQLEVHMAAMQSRVRNVQPATGPTTALHTAARSGQLKKVKELLGAGADMEARDKDGRTALILAVQGGHLKVVRELLKAGADKEARDQNGQTALHAAVISVELVQELIRAGADVYASDTSHETPFFAAVRRGRVEVMRVLAQAGADINFRSKDQSTPLHAAANNGAVEVVRALTVLGADLEAVDGESRTPLLVAIELEKPQVVMRELIKAGSDMEARDKNGWAALHLAVKAGLPEIVKELLLAGADYEARIKGFGDDKGYDRFTPEDVAYGEDRPDLVKMLNDWAAKASATGNGKGRM